ncbi:hypothetical protein [Alphaspiravirus yamagawaense]|uniref:Uncharacterized protein n=1 Tax=Alphaspiravirus yamagawaense TaxID=1157339 RepID=J7Q200_9VIRU|nr:hypothetical protein [Aeropyrum coil-shaped virus]CCG27820.1 hypothetical protein [Aeropyrum coil-shaped virus]
MPFWQSEIIKVIVKYKEPATIENEKVERGILETGNISWSSGAINEFLLLLNPKGVMDVDSKKQPTPFMNSGGRPTGNHFNLNAKASYEHIPLITFSVEAA